MRNSLFLRAVLLCAVASLAGGAASAATSKFDGADAPWV